MMAQRPSDLKLYSSIKEIPVDWLWYPYIPYGKLTLLQGDPGGGKSTFIVNIISAVSSGGNLPDGTGLAKPLHVIYQCSEDGVADTIKPRLIAAGANCENVAFIDEESTTFTLNDEVIRCAVADFNAKLLVVDPFQAYLGDADISNITSIRRILRKLSMWAAAYDCAIVLIGHLNKKQSSKDIYRGLGSIDLIAAARSVLQIDIDEDYPQYRIVRHIKSSLAPKGPSFGFQIDSHSNLNWTILDPDDREPNLDLPDELTSMGKQEQICSLLKGALSHGPARATDIQSLMQREAVSQRSLMLAKTMLNIGSFRQGGVWYWAYKDKTERGKNHDAE